MAACLPSIWDIHITSILLSTVLRGTITRRTVRMLVRKQMINCRLCQTHDPELVPSISHPHTTCSLKIPLSDTPISHSSYKSPLSTKASYPIISHTSTCPAHRNLVNSVPITQNCIIHGGPRYSRTLTAMNMKTIVLRV
jgi:hypothetical protein